MSTMTSGSSAFPERLTRAAQTGLLVSANQAAWIIMTVGAVLRVARYWANRSLWLDEVLLSTNILNRSFAGLLRPLDQDQAAPVGFLLLQKLAVTLLGTSEYALRIVPLLAGVVALPLFYGVARRVLDKWGAVLALALFAVCEPLIYFSSEAKQYGVDVAVALGILLAGLRAAESRSVGRKIVLGCVGAVGIWLSHPSVFVLGGMGCVMIAYEWIRRRRHSAMQLAGIALMWVGLFAVHYGLFMRHLAGAGYLRRYWAFGFMPLPPSGASVKWLATTAYEVFKDPVALLLPQLAIVAAGLGCVGLLRQSRRTAMMVGMPAVVTLGAAVAQVYPFAGRLILFLTPVVLVFIAAGVVFLWNSLLRERAWIAGLLAVALVAPATLLAGRNLVLPPGREEIRPVLAYVAERAQPGDTLYVYYGGKLVVEYYAAQYGLAGHPRVVGRINRDDWLAYVDELTRLGGVSRVWVIFSHPWTLHGVDEEKLFTLTLDRLGRRLDEVKQPGASAYLYDLSGSGAETGLPVHRSGGASYSEPQPGRSGVEQPVR